MTHRPTLARPARAGYSREYMWCSKCGAPKWVEWPSHLKRGKDTVTLGEPTCDCGRGWHGGDPNPVNAAKQPPGWHVRSLVGIIDTQADIEAYYLEQLANAIQSGLDGYENACKECPSLKTYRDLDVLLDIASGVRDKLVEQVKARKS